MTYTYHAYYREYNYHLHSEAVKWDVELRGITVHRPDGGALYDSFNKGDLFSIASADGKIIWEHRP